jgi:hypothetical protein
VAFAKVAQFRVLHWCRVHLLQLDRATRSAKVAFAKRRRSSSQCHAAKSFVLFESQFSFTRLFEEDDFLATALGEEAPDINGDSQGRTLRKRR